MISSAKTLLLATLVFNAATVFGAPIRNVDTSSESVARAEKSTPVQPIARAAIVDVQDNRRRSRLGHITRRSARLVSERDEPLPEAVVVREPAPAVDVVAPTVESRERRYPRRALHDRHEHHEKRKPAITVLGTTMVPAVERRERRYPRRALHDRHENEKRATSIKETTTVVEKITVLDTPEDALAFNSGNSDNSATTVSTLVSISATTTLASDSAAPTPTATDSASSTDSSASVTASASATSTTDSASVTPTPTSSASDSASTTASATDTASSGDPTATASSTSSADSADPTATPAVSVVTPDPAAAGDTNTDVRRGIYIRASTEPILRRLAFSGPAWASSIRRQLNTH